MAEVVLDRAAIPSQTVKNTWQGPLMLITLVMDLITLRLPSPISARLWMMDEGNRWLAAETNQVFCFSVQIPCCSFGKDAEPSYDASPRTCLLDLGWQSWQYSRALCEMSFRYEVTIQHNAAKWGGVRVRSTLAL